MNCLNYLTKGTVEIYTEVRRGIQLGKEVRKHISILDDLSGADLSDRVVGEASISRLKQIFAETEHGFFVNLGLNLGYRLTRK